MEFFRKCCEVIMRQQIMQQTKNIEKYQQRKLFSVLLQKHAKSV